LPAHLIDRIDQLLLHAGNRLDLFLADLGKLRGLDAGYARFG
jgi:hypothetical protein